MDIGKETAVEEAFPSALARARAVSQALADAARLARVSKRSRRALTGGGFSARRGARAARFALWVSFVVMVAIPSLSAAAYYAFIASDQYVAEAKFTVSGGEPPSAESFGAFAGIPLIAIVQDTQIVTNYIHSRDAVEKLDRSIGLRSLYASPDADFLARFNPKKPIEKLVDYWGRMSSVSIGMPAGIVDLQVRAFHPQDAARIAGAVVRLSEDLINNLNSRMNQDSVTHAEQELARMSERLAAARSALETAQNDTGVLDAQKTSDALTKLVMDTRAALLRLQQEYDAQLEYVDADAPQMLVLKSRIDATSSQIADLQAELTSPTETADDQPTLATSMTKFAELDLERQVAEKLYESAAASLETAHLMAEHKMMFLDTFVLPEEPQEATYPRRLLDALGIFAATLVAWALCCGLAAAIRNHKA